MRSPFLLLCPPGGHGGPGSPSGTWRSRRALGLPRGSWVNCPEGGSRAGHLVRDPRGRGATLLGQRALGTFTRDWSPLSLGPRGRGHRSSLAVLQREFHSCGGLCVPAAPGVWSEPPCSARRFTEEIRGTLCSLGSVGHPEWGCLFAQGGQPVVKRRRRRRHPLSHSTLALFKVGAQSRGPDPEDFIADVKTREATHWPRTTPQGDARAPGDLHTHFSRGLGKGP